MKIVVAAALFAALTACSSGGGRNPLCTCDADQMYDDTTKTCVAPADFVAPTDCTDDQTAVCGCDNKGYTSSCAAYAVGVEVQYAGTCNAGSTGSTGGGFGW